MKAVPKKKKTARVFRHLFKYSGNELDSMMVRSIKKSGDELQYSN